MIVAGGTYAETCRYPEWDQIYGSGLRAAVAVSEVSPATTLCSYVPDDWLDDVRSTLNSFGLGGEIENTTSHITFGYLDAFQRWGHPTECNVGLSPLSVKGDVVLRFGMLEGDAIVDAGRAVYDPQGSNAFFELNGSKCSELVYIMNEDELLRMGAMPPTHPIDMPRADAVREAVIAVRERMEIPQAVILKDKFGGLTVFRGEEPEHIPTYASESFFRIGAGDILAAAFTHAWGELRLDTLAAADYAARCLAFYVEGPRLPLPGPSALTDRKPSEIRSKPIKLVGLGDFEVQSLIINTTSWIYHLGGEIDAATFTPALRPASLDEADLLFIGSDIKDREELLELASKVGTPAVVFWPCKTRGLDAQALFPSSVIAQDYATALYHALRRPMP